MNRCAFLVILVFAFSGAAAQMVDPEIKLRAISTPIPKWPDADARQCRNGVAKFKAAVRPDGRVTDVVILSAPTERIAKTLTKTVLQWKFAPFAWPDGSDKATWLEVPVTYDGPGCPPLRPNSSFKPTPLRGAA
jgi:TonB family protein